MNNSVTKSPDSPKRTLKDKFIKAHFDKLSRRQGRARRETTKPEAGGAAHGEEVERIASWHERAHEENKKIARLVERIRPNGPDLAKRLRDCGSMIVLAESPTTGKMERAGAHYCRLWWLCPGCCGRRAKRKWHQLNDTIRALVANQSDLRVYAVTLTLKWDRDLLRNFRAFDRALARLHKDASYRRAGWKKGWTELASVIAGVDNIEVERSPNGFWRVHAHAIWVCDREVYERRLADEWREASHGSHQVRVREVQFIGDQDDDDEDDDDLDPALRYALKGVKHVRAPDGEDEEAELSLKDRCEAFRLLRNVSGRGKPKLPRMFRTYGKLRGVKIRDVKVVDDEPRRRIVLRRTGGKYVAQCPANDGVAPG